MRNELSDAEKVVRVLREFRNPANIAGMTKFGINPKNTLGVSIPVLRDLAKELGKNHKLALDLWKTGIHEARLVAAFIDMPWEVNERQMEAWVKDFDSWDICDQVCSNLFDKTEPAVEKIIAWSNRKEEFVKRAGFVLMASLAVHNKELVDDTFISFLSIIKRESIDERNFVRKSVNWALRQIGKRNMKLNKAATKTALQILETDSKAAKWIANDALRELTSSVTIKRLKTKRSNTGKCPKR